ncbi:hypothetical protein GX586_08330, partial [bacterium]|nr:hypothetical protein [bacterium]
MNDSDLLPMLRLNGLNTWEMPHLPSINKLPPRATLYPHATAADALAMRREASPWFLPLNGAWDFKIKTRPEEATHDAVAHGA